MVKGLNGFVFALTTFIVGTALIVIGVQVLALAIVLAVALPGAGLYYATHKRAA